MSKHIPTWASGLYDGETHHFMTDKAPLHIMQDAIGRWTIYEVFGWGIHGSPAAQIKQTLGSYPTLDEAKLAYKFIVTTHAYG